MRSRWPRLSLTAPQTGWLLAGLFALALAAALWRVPAVAPVDFLTDRASGMPGKTLPALLQGGMLPGVGSLASRPSLALLPDGRIAAAWVGGTERRYGAASLWFSIRGDQGWSEPQAIASREGLAAALFAHIDAPGSPSLQVAGERLHLYFTSHSSFGEALVHSQSADHGRSWSGAQRIQSSPFANHRLQPASPAIPLVDGGTLLPVSQHLLAGSGELLRLSADSQVVDKIRLPLPGKLQQPNVVVNGPREMLVVGRIAAPDNARPLARLHSEDGGLTWQTTEIELAINPRAPIALLRLSGQRLLLAGNAPDGRGTLQLWLSDDAGHAWRLARTLESASDGAADFSEPSLLLAGDGSIHVAYAWRQQGIKHLRLSEAWLNGGNP